MTTPSKADKQRPYVAYEANDCGYYSQSDADALFESLETELRDTKRALEHCANWYTDGNKPQEVIDYYMEKARKERAALPDPPTVADSKRGEM